MSGSLSRRLVALGLAGLLGSLLAGGLAGCGSSDSGGGAAANQAAALQTAVEDYLRQRNMDMEVVRLKDVAVEELTASAAAVLKEREALHDVTVTWQFTFARPGRASTWTVTEVKR